MIRQNWGKENPVARQMMTSIFMPDASQKEAEWFNEFQKACGPGDNIARFREVFDDIDVSELLTEIHIPTLVFHCTGDSVAPLSEGKLVASRIEGARFVTVNSNSHLLLKNEPGFQRFIDAVHDFMQTN